MAATPSIRLEIGRQMTPLRCFRELERVDEQLTAAPNTSVELWLRGWRRGFAAAQFARLFGDGKKSPLRFALTWVLLPSWHAFLFWSQGRNRTTLSRREGDWFVVTSLPEQVDLSRDESAGLGAVPRPND